MHMKKFVVVVVYGTAGAVIKSSSADALDKLSSKKVLSLIDACLDGGPHTLLCIVCANKKKREESMYRKKFSFRVICLISCLPQPAKSN